MFTRPTDDMLAVRTIHRASQDAAFEQLVFTTHARLFGPEACLQKDIGQLTDECDAALPPDQPMTDEEVLAVIDLAFEPTELAA